MASMSIGGYASSKFAVEGFAEALHQEMMPFGVYVSVLEPGLIATPHFTVHRNRARRRLKAAAALIMPVHAAAGRDYVAIARETTADLPWLALLEDFRKALGRLGALVETR